MQIEFNRASLRAEIMLLCFNGLSPDPFIFELISIYLLFFIHYFNAWRFLNLCRSSIIRLKLVLLLNLVISKLLTQPLHRGTRGISLFERARIPSDMIGSYMHLWGGLSLSPHEMTCGGRLLATPLVQLVHVWKVVLAISPSSGIQNFFIQTPSLNSHDSHLFSPQLSLTHTSNI